VAGRGQEGQGGSRGCSCELLREEKWSGGGKREAAAMVPHFIQMWWEGSRGGGVVRGATQGQGGWGPSAVVERHCRPATARGRWAGRVCTAGTEQG
jgi:hypothetical protein